MTGLERRIEIALAGLSDPGERQDREKLIRGNYARDQERLARTRSFKNPVGTMAQAVAYVKQAQTSKQPVIIDAHGTSVRLQWVKRDVFLAIHGQQSRWGTAMEIAEDINHFLEAGSLPYSGGHRFY